MSATIEILTISIAMIVFAYAILLLATCVSLAIRKISNATKGTEMKSAKERSIKIRKLLAGIVNKTRSKKGCCFERNKENKNTQGQSGNQDK